jgi:hypothetical protein
MKREECRWLNGSAINPTLKAGRVYGFSQLPSTYGARTSEQAPFPSHPMCAVCFASSSRPMAGGQVAWSRTQALVRCRPSISGACVRRCAAQSMALD